jgi:hypothetical protein
MNGGDNTYYNIMLSYEIPYNVLDSQDPSVIQARDNLYDRLAVIIPSKYELFSVKLVLYQLKDTYNFLVTYSAYFRSTTGLPMSEYVGARDLKNLISSEIEEFFNSVDCEYKQLNIKSLV